MIKSFKVVGQFLLFFVVLLSIPIIGGAFYDLTPLQIAFFVLASVSSVIITSSAKKHTHRLGDKESDTYLNGSNIVKQSGWSYGFNPGDSFDRLCDFSINGIRAIKAMRPLELQQEMTDDIKPTLCSKGFKCAKDEIEFLHKRCKIYENAMKIEITKSLDDFERYFAQYMEAYMRQVLSEESEIAEQV